MPRTLLLLLLACALAPHRAASRRLQHSPPAPAALDPDAAARRAGARRLAQTCVDLWNNACPAGLDAQTCCANVQALGTDCLVELAVNAAAQDPSGALLNNLCVPGASGF